MESAGASQGGGQVGHRGPLKVIRFRKGRLWFCEFRAQHPLPFHYRPDRTHVARITGDLTVPRLPHILAAQMPDLPQTPSEASPRNNPYPLIPSPAWQVSKPLDVPQWFLLLGDHKSFCKGKDPGQGIEGLCDHILSPVLPLSSHDLGPVSHFVHHG